MILINKLDELLETKGVSSEDLSCSTGLTRMTIFNARKGSGVTLNTAILIAQALDVSIEDIWQTADTDPQEKEAA